MADYTDRLSDICKWIVEERFGDDPEAVIEWRVNNWQASITTAHMYAVISWIKSGPHVGQIEVEYSRIGEGAGIHAGDVTLMYIAAAMWPEGDNVVAETINEQLV